MARPRRRLTHLDHAGRARMVDVSAKPVTVREAVARGDVSLAVDTAGSRVTIEGRARVEGRTGVEMEALTAVAVAGLTLYDMCKAVDREMTLGAIRLVRKTGGRSGTFVRRGERS